MTTPVLPNDGEVFLDARGGDRMLRVSWHREIGPTGTLILSLWRDGRCTATFRMHGEEASLLLEVIAGHSASIDSVLANTGGIVARRSA